MIRWSWLGVVGSVLFPPAGLGAFLLIRLLTKGTYRFAPLAPWLLVWIGLLLPLPFQILAGRLPVWLVGQFLLACTASAVLIAPRRALLVGCTAALVLFLAGGLLERGASQRLWFDTWPPPSLDAKLSPISVLSGSGPGWRRNGSRLFEKSWQVQPAETDLVLTLEAKLQEGVTGWDWYTYHPGTIRRYVHDGGNMDFIRIINPDSSRRYVSRRIFTDSPIAGRTFRAILELRTPKRVIAEGCAGLALLTYQESYQACRTLELTPDWGLYTIEATFPDSAELPAFELMIRQIPGPHFDVGNVMLEERTAGGWIEAPYAEPAGVVVRLPIPDTHPFLYPALRFVPGDDWQRYTLNIDNQAIHHLGGRLKFQMQLESGTEVAFRDIRLVAADADAPHPRPIPASRFAVWFPHANLAGHTLAVGGVVALAAASSAPWASAVIASTLGAVYLTGSRAAWLGALVGLGWLAWLAAGRWRWHLFTAVAIATVGIAVVGASEFTSVRVFSTETLNPISRWTIWSQAWQAVLERPITGLGEKGVDTYWNSVAEGAEHTRVFHAHNLWLEFGSRYGLPGLAAAVWISVGMVFLAWRRWAWRGVATIGSVLAMNTFDVTLLYSGVLFLVILGLNTPRPLNGLPQRRSLPGESPERAAVGDGL